MIPDQMGLPADTPRYKGNLHSHTTLSDGNLTPEESAAAFRAHGYHFLCLSEHDLYTDHSAAFDADGFIILPGLEASAVLLDDPVHRRCLKVHHMHGILGTDEMLAAAPKRFEHGERLEPEVFFGEWDGFAVAEHLGRVLAEHGCAVTYNHPIWSRVDMSDVQGLTCAFGIEVFNYNTVNECALGYDTVFWDALLRQGIRINGIAADDNHNGGVFDDAFGGWAVVCAPELTRDAVVRALMDGAYYSSSGPEVRNFGVSGGMAWVECGPCERVNMIAGGFVGAGETRIAPAGELIERAEFPLRGDETYLRFECVDERGQTAWTNPLYGV